MDNNLYGHAEDELHRFEPIKDTNLLAAGFHAAGSVCLHRKFSTTSGGMSTGQKRALLEEPKTRGPGRLCLFKSVDLHRLIAVIGADVQLGLVRQNLVLALKRDIARIVQHHREATKLMTFRLNIDNVTRVSF